jgi:hypothetical protein
MRGKLNLFQASMLRWKELHPYSAVHAVRVAGTLDRARMKDAIESELEARGLTHLALDARGGRYDYAGGAATVVLEVLQGGADPREVLRAEIERQLNAPFPADGAFDPFRFFVVDGQAAFDLALAYDHFVAGGDSIVLLLQAIVARYTTHGEVRSPATPPPALYPATFRRLLLPHAGAMLRGTLSLPRLAWSCRQSNRPRYLIWPPSTNGYVSFRLEPGEFAAILRTTKQWNVSLNDLFIAVMLQSLAPLAEGRLKSRHRFYMAAASIINIRHDVGAGVRDFFGQFLSSFRVAHRVPPGISLRELARDIRAQSSQWRKRRLYLQTLVVMGYTSIVWRFLGLPQRQGFHHKNWPVWAGVTMLNVDALWREGGAADAPPPYLRAVSTGPLAPVVFAVTTVGGAIEAGISYRTAAFEEGGAAALAARVRATLQSMAKTATGGTVE